MSSKLEVSRAEIEKFPSGHGRKRKSINKKGRNPSCTLRYDGQWMDNQAASAAWTDGQRSSRRERRSYFTADCLMLPTRANYTDYSCESCMAELYNYKDPVRVIMCCGKSKKKVSDGDFSSTSNGSIRQFFNRVWCIIIFNHLSPQRSFTTIVISCDYKSIFNF